MFEVCWLFMPYKTPDSYETPDIYKSPDNNKTPDNYQNLIPYTSKKDDWGVIFIP